MAKHLFPTVGAAGTAWLRLTFAALILAAVRRPWRIRVQPGQRWAIVLYGISLGTMNLLFYMALARIPLAVAVAVEFTGPFTLALIASRRPLDFAFVALAALGIALLLPIHPAAQTLDPVGIMLSLGAGAGWAGYIVFGKRASVLGDGSVVPVLGMIIGAAVVTPWGAAPAVRALLSDPTLIPLAVSVAILSSALPYSCEIVALRTLPALYFSILMSLEPAMAALSGMLFLHEYLTPGQCLAIACIMTASLGVCMSMRRQTGTSS